MLEELNIKDFALIENDYLEFEKGFTILAAKLVPVNQSLSGLCPFCLEVKPK